MKMKKTSRLAQALLYPIPITRDALSEDTALDAQGMAGVIFLLGVFAPVALTLFFLGFEVFEWGWWIIPPGCYVVGLLLNLDYRSRFGWD